MALITKVADCESILLYDPVKKVIGNIHAGWRGTLNKIVSKSIHIFVNDYDSNPEDIIACISPSLNKCCSEFSQYESDLFKTNFSYAFEFIEEKNNKYYIDTNGINMNELINAGLKKENIVDSLICTKCNKDKYHSYRADNHTDKRNISFILLK